MPNTPTAVATAPTSRRFLRRAALFGTIALGAAAWFFGDVPNRYRAHQVLEEASRAELVSDWTRNLELCREAAFLRPRDQGIVVRYQEAQHGWIAWVGREVQSLPPYEGYAALQRLSAHRSLLGREWDGQWREIERTAVAAVAREVQGALTAVRKAAEAGDFPAANRELEALQPWAALVPEVAQARPALRATQLAAAMKTAKQAMEAGRFDAARETLRGAAGLADGSEEFRKLGPAIDVAEVRATLRAARRAWEEEDFDVAQQQLERAAATKLVPAEVQVARETFAYEVRRMLVRKVSQALLAGEDDRVAEAIAEGRRHAGWEEMTARDLVAPADLPAFLQALDRLGLGPKAQAEAMDRADVRLVLALAARKRLPALPANDHVKDSLVAASRRARELGYPGLAVFLYGQAAMRRAAPDRTWQEETLAEAIKSTDITLGIEIPPEDAGTPAGLHAAMAGRVRDALTREIGRWPGLAHRDATEATVVLRGEYVPFKYVEGTPVVKTAAVRYQSGTKRVANPERDRLVEEYNSIMRERNSLVGSIDQNQATVDDVHNTYGSGNASSAGAAGALVFQRHRLGKLEALLDDLDTRIDRLPEYVTEAAYASEPYKIVDRQYQATMGWRLVTGDDEEELVVAEWVAGTRREIREVIGNASRGVPVQAAPAFPVSEVKNGLVGMVALQAADVSELLRQLPAVTGELFNRRYARADDFQKADRALALCYAWDWAGRKLEEQPKIEQSAAALFGLTL